MRSKNSFRIFTGAYNLARSAKLLENSWAKRAFVSSYFLYKRFWEDPFWDLIQRKPELFENGDVLDIGANVGYTSCLFARAVKPGAKVYSFEPDKANFQMLTEVIHRKNLSERVVAMNSAVGKTDGFIELWHNEKHSGDHRIVTDHFRNDLQDSDQVSTVPVVSVDSFVDANKLRQISFIKIDVQGYEIAVCEGMKQTLLSSPNLCVCCEYSPEGMVELGFDPAHLLDIFRMNGYRIHILTRSSISLAQDNSTIQKAAGEAGYVDLLCAQKIIE